MYHSFETFWGKQKQLAGCSVVEDNEENLRS